MIYLRRIPHTDSKDPAKMLVLDFFIGASTQRAWRGGGGGGGGGKRNASGFVNDLSDEFLSVDVAYDSMLPVSVAAHKIKKRDWDGGDTGV